LTRGDLPWTFNFIKLLSLTIENYRRVMGVGRNAAYASVHRGDVETMRVGDRILVLTAPLRRKLGIEVAE
jgi:hypothetical protein